MGVDFWFRSSRTAGPYYSCGREDGFLAPGPLLLDYRRAALPEDGRFRSSVIGMNPLSRYGVGLFLRSFRMMADTLVGGLAQYTAAGTDAIGWFVAMSILSGLYCLYRTRPLSKSDAFHSPPCENRAEHHQRLPKNEKTFKGGWPCDSPNGI